MEKAFIYGMSVGGNNFTDRIEETKRIRLDFENGINVILISPRRMGKTSLIKKVISENVWIDIVKQKIINSKHENIVIDDIRFKNELFELSNLNKNVLIIKLTRDCEIKSEHISEHDLDDTIVPNIINNNGTKEELFKLVDSLIL